MADYQSLDPELVEYLEGLGATPEQLAYAIRTGHAGGLSGDLVLSRDATMTVGQLAAVAGLPEEKILSIWRDMGIVPEPGEVRFSKADVEILETLLSATDLELKGGELLRVIGASMSRVADAAVALYVQNVEDRPGRGGLTQLQIAKDLAQVMTLGLEIGERLLGPLLAQHLREAITRQRVTQSDVSERIVARMGIGFVDLVGSTKMANDLSSREFLDQVASFESRAFDVASDHGGRIVKMVGDEVMFMAVSAHLACKVALTMMEEFTAGGVQPRGGIAFGEVITYHGDYYGPVVNLASRLTDHAVPGEILVDTGVRESSDSDDIDFEPAGRRQLKGFDEPVPVYSLSRGAALRR
jgi:adenylate cyclase